MRVLWFSCTPSCYDIISKGGWIESLERIVKLYLPDVQLGIAFEHVDRKFKVEHSGVTYYPINCEYGMVKKIRNKIFSSSRLKYEKLKPAYLKVIQDFKPDIIQCFGSELWHYSLLQKDVDIPFVVHIMGFWNIYNMMSDVLLCKNASMFHWSLVKMISERKRKIDASEHEEMERETMQCIKYFMGRTEWDKAIVRNFSPNAIYFHCPEAIRPDIYNSDLKWKFKKESKIRLITVSNAGNLKGNEIMLRTAWILKYRFNQSVEWLLTATSEAIKPFEKQTGIKCSDVNIKLLGGLRASDIPKVICQSELFIHCAIIDNSPNALCEAQLLGIPIIATNAGGIPQIVTDNEDGFLYPYAEPYALAFKIMELHNNEDELLRISQNAYQTSHCRHNPVMIAQTLRKIYNQIIAYSHQEE